MVPEASGNGEVFTRCVPLERTKSRLRSHRVTLYRGPEGRSGVSRRRAAEPGGQISARAPAVLAVHGWRAGRRPRPV